MPTLAVLFDFDGVIADAENVHVAAWQRTFGVMGWLESDETCAEAAGLDDRAFVAGVFARRKIDGGDVDGWVARKRELARRMLAESPRLFPGVAALVARLEGRARLGVVATASRGDVEAVLGASGLAGAFEVVVAGEDVRAARPDPEGYRLALARLGLPGDSVAALEGSGAGLEAAKGAGLRAVAVDPRRAKGDGGPLPGLLDLPRVLEALGLAG